MNLKYYLANFLWVPFKHDCQKVPYTDDNCAFNSEPHQKKTKKQQKSNTNIHVNWISNINKTINLSTYTFKQIKLGKSTNNLNISVPY